MRKGGTSTLASASLLDYNEDEIDWNAEFRDDDEAFSIDDEDIDARMDELLNGKKSPPIPTSPTTGLAVSKPVFPQLQPAPVAAKGMMRLTKSTDKEKEKETDATEPTRMLERPSSPSKDKQKEPVKPMSKFYSLQKKPPSEEDEDEVVAFDVRELKKEPAEKKAVQEFTNSRPPPPSIVTPAIMPRIEFDLEAGVAPSSRYNSFIELKRMSYSVKIICIVHVLASFYFAMFPDFRWGFIWAIVTVPLGFWGAHSFRPKILFSFLVCLAVNILGALLLMVLELYKDAIKGPELALGFVFIISELFMLHTSYTFWKKLPKSSDFYSTFNQFFSSPHSRIGGIAGDEDDKL